MGRLETAFKPESKYRAFFLSVMTFSLAYGLYKGVIDNYLVEIVGMSGFDKGVSEFFRELPGLLLVFILAALYTFSAERIYKLGALFMLAGMAAQAVVSPTRVMVILCIFVYSLGDHMQLGMRNKLQEVDGLSTQSKYQSATEAAYVGGDFYDLVRLPKRHACAIMGDVSGKGVEAASVSSAVKTALAAYAWEGLTPARMVSLLNDFLLGFSRIETFATMFVGIVDLKNATLSYCSAGHPPALLVRARTGELVTLGVQSGVVGAFEGLRYLNGEVVLENGDILVLYTDGVTEARDSEGAFFGEDGLHDVLLREVTAGFDGLCDRILDSVSSFAGGSLEDDVSLVVIRFDSVGSSGKA